MPVQYSPLSTWWGELTRRRTGNSLEASTRDLLEEVRHGDANAREVLYGRYAERLSRWARGRLPSSARDLMDTGDVVQETLTRSFQNLDHFEPRHEGAFQAYLRRGILNRIRDEIRRIGRAPRRSGTASNLAADEASPLQRAIGLETLELYDAALERLRPADREALVGRIELGLSYAEIASALGKPTADAARMAVGRAILRLAEEMTT